MTQMEQAVHGDFHVVRMNGLFHVVFRPDTDPEWFRIIATFFTYERAYSYCDIERVSVWTYTDNSTGKVHADSETGEEEMLGLHSAPIHLALPESSLDSPDGIAAMVRGIYEGDENVEPHPMEDFSDHPNENEDPKDYRRRLHEDAVEAVAAVPLPEPEPEIDQEPEADPCAEALKDLSDNQWSVLKSLQHRADADQTINASMKEIATEAGVAQGSMPYFLETLDRKGFIETVERGSPTSSAIYRLIGPAVMRTASEATAAK